MWAFIADVDLESEVYRDLGSFRYTILAIKRMVLKRTYQGRLFILPPKDATEHKITTNDSLIGPSRQYTSASSSSYESWPIALETDFQMFVATNMPFISNTHKMSPTTTINDGQMHVVWSHKLTLGCTMSFLLDGLSAKFYEYSCIKSQKCVAFVLDPYGYVYGKSPPISRENSQSSVLERPEYRGILDCSGERIKYMPIKVEVLPSILRVCCPANFDVNQVKDSFKGSITDAF
jgi:hypothetical protein